jgi:flavin-dependent dehydrogenase
MESAVRSGYLAAEAIASAIGRPERFLIPDLPRGLWSRLLIRSP